MKPCFLGRKTVFGLKVDGDDGADRAWTLSEDENTVGNADGFREVVGDQKRGNLLFPDDVYNVAGDVQPGLIVQSAERFIQQQKRRMTGEGADQSRPLAHASGKFVGMSVGKISDIVLFHKGTDIA